MWETAIGLLKIALLSTSVSKRISIAKRVTDLTVRNFGCWWSQSTVTSCPLDDNGMEILPLFYLEPYRNISSPGE